MLENTLETFAANIFLFIVGESKIRRGHLIKKHCENFQSHGDFSFPNTVKSWHEHIDCKRISNKSSSLLGSVGKETGDFIDESRKWSFELKNVTEEKHRVYLFLDRSKAICVGLLEAIKNNKFISRNLADGTLIVHCDPECEAKNCLTSLRLKYFCKVVENLCSIYFKPGDNPNRIIVTSKSSRKSDTDRIILCGSVLNVKTGVKEVLVSADDFIRLRQKEMTLIAQHKYGLRVATEQKWKEFIAHLGESAAAFELLEVKPNSAIKINFDCSSAGSSKGAAFVLYNCARLETIIRTYNNRVTAKEYPPLPSFQDTDFTLLTQEDEWCLVFNFVLGFPSVLNNCVEVNETACEFRPHQLCSFLCSMVRVFSQYYRRVRILTEPRQHLLPVMFARIHMLKVLNDVLKTCLNILNIKSVSQMYMHFLLPFFHRFLRDVGHNWLLTGEVHPLHRIL